MSWDTAKKRAEEASAGMFVKLQNDGDRVVGVIVGDPHIKEVVWNNATNTFDDFTPEHAKAGLKPGAKFMLNIFVLADMSMKIIEMSNATFKDVCGVREKFNFDKFSIDIKRNGKKGDTKTTYSVLPDVEITPEQRTAIAAAKLHDLAKVAASDTPDAQTDMNSHGKPAATNGAAAAAPAAGPALIDDATKEALVTRLKALASKPKVDEFLAHFKIEKIKGLKATDLPAALAFVDKLEGKTAAPVAADAFD